MAPEQITALRTSFVVVEEKAEIAALVFYRNLFQLAPELRPLFSTSMEVQSRKLMESLRQTVALLEKPEVLVPVLEGLGRRHISYGTKPEHYAVVLNAMLLMLAEVLDRRFSPEVAKAWQEALSWVASVMQQGAAASLPVAP